MMIALVQMMTGEESGVVALVDEKVVVALSPEIEAEIGKLIAKAFCKQVYI